MHSIPVSATDEATKILMFLRAEEQRGMRQISADRTLPRPSG